MASKVNTGTKKNGSFDKRTFRIPLVAVPDKRSKKKKIAAAIGKAFSNAQMVALALVKTVAVDHKEQAHTWADIYATQARIVFPTFASLTWERWKFAAAFIKADDGEFAKQQFAAAVAELRYNTLGKVPNAGDKRATGTAANKGMNAARWATALGKQVLAIVEYAAKGKALDVNAALMSSLTDAIAGMVGAERSIAAFYKEDKEASKAA